MPYTPRRKRKVKKGKGAPRVNRGDGDEAPFLRDIRFVVREELAASGRGVRLDVAVARGDHPPPDPAFKVPTGTELVRRVLLDEYSRPGVEDAEVERQVTVALRMLGLVKEPFHQYNKKPTYNMTRLEVIEIIDDHNLDFYRGNIIKYCLRAPHTPDPLDQVLKAQYYLNRLVALTKQGKGPLASHMVAAQDKVPT